MTRLELLSTLLIAGLAATGAAMWTARDQEPVQGRSAVPSDGPRKPGPAPRHDPGRAVEVVTLRVVDLHGRGVPDVEVEVLVRSFDLDGPRYRTGADGRVRIPVDPYADASSGTRFVARPDGRTIGWAYLAGPPVPKDEAVDSISMVLLPRTHRVEGSVVDRAGRPIPGVQIRAISAQHPTNQVLAEFTLRPLDSLIGSAVTDAAGRYALSLPEQAKAVLMALHPRYVGPALDCGPDDRTLAPVTLEDAGGIAGTVVDGATGRPVEGVTLHAGRIEFDGSKLMGSGWAMTDAHGLFRIGGLAPGVYNLCLNASPRGDRFTARAIEGVRIRAGGDAPADLRLVEGRRVHGTAVDAKTGRPMGRVSLNCSSAALPNSGHAGASGYTDDEGRFEFFVPPGLACVYLSQGNRYADKGPDTKTLIVAPERDPDPVRLLGGYDPGDPSFRSTFTPGLPTQVRVRAEVLKGQTKEGGRKLMGRVFDQDGSPIAGVRVTCRQGNRTMTYATDRLGVFRVNGLPSDEIFMGLGKKGYRGASAIIPPEAREVEITLTRKPATAY